MVALKFSGRVRLPSEAGFAALPLLGRTVRNQYSDDNESIASVSNGEDEKSCREAREELESVSWTKERPAKRCQDGHRKRWGKLPELAKEQIDS